jgi:hypothetical protein
MKKNSLNQPIPQLRSRRKSSLMLTVLKLLDMRQGSLEELSSTYIFAVPSPMYGITRLRITGVDVKLNFIRRAYPVVRTPHGCLPARLNNTIVILD